MDHNADMKRIIFSLYIDIDKSELDYQAPYAWDTEQLPKTEKTKLLFQEYYPWLKERHIDYARALGIDYTLYENDEKWYEFKKYFNKTYPQVTAYNVVNFYKIHLLYELSKEYDEILYLDFDVVPLNNDNFFEAWNLQNNGIAILQNNAHVLYRYHEVTDSVHISSIRSPTAKHWNCKAMLIECNMSGDNDVFNTGIIGAAAKDIKKLDYWSDFDKTIALMDTLKSDVDMWPKEIRLMFGYDNETIWGYKVKMNDVKIQWLDEKWHHFLDRWDYIKPGCTLCHVINKKFKYVRNWYEKNSL
jgi:hypothetical protein